ncbi:MAG: hypothetical protein AB7O97_02890 [Planctomycetota bacterium]
MDAQKVLELKQQFRAMGSPPEYLDALRRAFQRNGMPVSMQDQILAELSPDCSAEPHEPIRDLRRQLQDLRDQASASGIDVRPLLQAHVTMLREQFDAAGIPRDDQDDLFEAVGASDPCGDADTFSQKQDEIVTWFDALVATSKDLQEAIRRAKSEVKADVPNKDLRRAVLMVVAAEAERLIAATGNAGSAEEQLRRLGLNLDGTEPSFWGRMFG